MKNFAPFFEWGWGEKYELKTKNSRVFPFNFFVFFLVKIKAGENVFEYLKYISSKYYKAKWVVGLMYIIPSIP